MLNHSEACERNKEPLFVTLDEYLPKTDLCSVLEIGSGSGQHAISFTTRRPNWQWQTTEMDDYVPALSENIAAYTPTQPPSKPLNVNDLPWSFPPVDFAVTANTLHIMDKTSVENFFKGVSSVLSNKGKLFIYGPFRYHDEFTSESNGNFDLWLKNRNSQSGIRDFEWIQSLAAKAGFSLVADRPMPANNQLLIWSKGS